MSSNFYQFEPIGVLKTCFKEKFGIPRQPRLIESATGILKLRPHPFFSNAIKNLEQFSHVWVVFVFHQHDAKNWKPSIRPPRLGGAKKVGVLASRSPHRPNPIGLSAVKLDRIDTSPADGIEIHLSGVDILDGTPVLDIKPYLTYSDSIPDAKQGWANETIVRIPVSFSEQAELSLNEKMKRNHPNLRDLIIGILELDPRPAFQKKRLPASSQEAEGTSYGFKLFEFDVKWNIQNSQFIVTDVINL